MKGLSESKEKPLVSLTVHTEGDVVLARRRARQLALLLGFDRQDQTRISTAVSEISRNAVVHAKGGKISFMLDDSGNPFTFVAVIADHGPGIDNKAEILARRTETTGLVGVSRLVDNFLIDTSSKGTVVRLYKNLAPRLPFTANEINELANSLTKMDAASALDEVHQQNQELLHALEQLSKKQALLDELNVELEEKNRSLRELNKEMMRLNDSFEAKVLERTDELLEANQFLKVARDEAALTSALKSQFVGNISHEIRTPMAGILGLAELLATDEGIPESSRELAENIKEAGQNLMNIVNDLLDFSKLEAGKMEVESVPLSVSNIVDDVIAGIAPLAKAKELQLKFAVDPSIPSTLYGDPIRIRQALHNIALNAIKFTEVGSVEIRADIQSKTDDLAVVRFSVKDTGIGVNAETQARLFEPFVQGDGTTTRKYGGTGLGLSIVKRFVELMLGAVGVQSEENSGSLFWFTVPLRLKEKRETR
jgi:signal transduction histidine kinase